MSASVQDVQEYDEFGNFIDLSDINLLVGDIHTQPKPAPARAVAADTKTKLFGFESLTEEEDNESLHTSLISHSHLVKPTPGLLDSETFMENISKIPSNIRNVAIVGQIHHGKTTLLHALATTSHTSGRSASPQGSQISAHTLTQHRGISIKSQPMSMLITSRTWHTHLFHVIDTPGHSDFVDEVAAAMRLADGAILVVDVVDGMSSSTELILRHMIEEKISFVAVLNKVDRLILELCLTPSDAYLKLLHTIESINVFLCSITADVSLRLSPERGNVAFASTSMSWCFTLESFADIYAAKYDMDIKSALSQRLWGNIFFDECRRTFTRKSPGPDAQPTFVKFILEPLYKLYGDVMIQDAASVQLDLRGSGIKLHAASYRLGPFTMLKSVLSHFFGYFSAMSDMMACMLPSPVINAARKVHSVFVGSQSTNTLSYLPYLENCDANGPLLVDIAKVYDAESANTFRCYGRIFSGTVQRGMVVKVIVDSCAEEKPEGLLHAVIENICLPATECLASLSTATAGNVVLFEGLDSLISKAATIMALSVESSHVCRPIRHMTTPVLKVAVEPINPSELPRMLLALRSVNKTYPLVVTRVEESGEHIVVGTGELYLDCVLHDLRRLYGSLEIKVSDPIACFAETVQDCSSTISTAFTPNKRNKLSMIAEPLESGIGNDIENSHASLTIGSRQLATYLEQNHGWDKLASRNLWAFGPTGCSPNVLINDALHTQKTGPSLEVVREHVVHGFRWGTREGPLCDEPVRNVKYRILEAELAHEIIFRGGGQIVPTVRRLCYSSFLLASPRLLEPVLNVELASPIDYISSIYTILARRRGHVTQDLPQVGSPLYLIKALLPVVDSNGFETDIRTASQGQVFLSQNFSHWSIVPGDPLDMAHEVVLVPASGQALAADLVTKTRRRKGLSENIMLTKYVSEST